MFPLRNLAHKELISRQWVIGKQWNWLLHPSEEYLWGLLSDVFLYCVIVNGTRTISLKIFPSQFQWKFPFFLIQILMKRSIQNFADGGPAMLSWHVQRFVNQGMNCSKANFVEFELWVKNCWWNGPLILSIPTLTHWGRDNMAAIFQTIFSNTFSWMITYKFWLQFHWSLFLRVQSTIFQHWLR